MPKLANIVIPNDDNFFGLEPELSNLDDSRFVVIQAPYDATLSYGKGAGRGPAAILKASQHVEFYDDELNRAPILEFGVCSTRALDVRCDGEVLGKRIYDVARQVVALGKIPVLVGGEHTVSYGAVRACWERHQPLSVLHFDAHSDLRETYHNTKWSHACAAARINELCPIVQVGIRSRECGDEGGRHGHPVWCYPAYKYRRGGAWYKQALSRLGEKVYITIDVDGFDPSVFPGTGTPEPGGLDWWTVVDLIHLVCRERTVVGFDIVEVSPIPGSQQSEFAAARLMGKVINYICHYQLSASGAAKTTSSKKAKKQKAVRKRT